MARIVPRTGAEGPGTRFAEGVQALGLSVMSFSGYTIEQIRARIVAGDEAAARLLAATDLLIDGPYLREHPDAVRPWVGSRNQRFHTLTAKYQHLGDRWDALPDRLEITVRPDGTTEVNGWADVPALESLFDGMRVASRSESRALPLAAPDSAPGHSYAPEKVVSS